MRLWGKQFSLKRSYAILKEPLLCPTCQKEDRLEKDVDQRRKI